MKDVTIGLITMECIVGDVDANLATMEHWLGRSHWRDCHCHATVTVLPTVTLLSCYCHLLSSTAAIVIMVKPYQPFLPAVTISK